MLRLARFSSVLAVALALGIAGCAPEKLTRGYDGSGGSGSGSTASSGGSGSSGSSSGGSSSGGSSGGQALTEAEAAQIAEELEQLTGAAPESTAKYFMETVGDRVHFAYDRHDLTDEARRVLKRQALWLSINPSATITVEGHCDERGTRSYNLALGARRAQSVKQYLTSAGILSNRVTTVSYGKERPVSLCSNESCWKTNRRGVSVVRGVPES